jgi:hypothetical protein
MLLGMQSHAIRNPIDASSLLFHRFANAPPPPVCRLAARW